MDWQSEIQTELDKAEGARKRGNEGQARVCARRAAGIATREYFVRRGARIHSSSAYDLLQLVSEDASVPASLRAIAARLTLRVDEEFKLPPGVDLIGEARQLCEGLAREVNK